MTFLKHSSEKEEHFPANASGKEKEQKASASAPKRPGMDLNKNTKKEQHIQLEGEKLHAAKHQRQVGEVMLHKEVVKDKQSLDVPVSHEEVFIERHSFNERPSYNERSLGDGETIHIPVSAEEVTISKDRVVLGDVVVGKRE